MSHSKVLGAIVIARNGDRTQCWQDPVTQESSDTQSTPLGEVQSYQLGQHLRNLYLNPDSPSHIRGIRTDLVDLSEIAVRVKAGVEGAAVFDSATALLQGLYPPTPKNSITLANETKIVAPLNGYQYIPVETVEPNNDRSLESWTNCPTFQKRVRQFHNSPEFQQAARQAQPFFHAIQEFVFGPVVASPENSYNVYDFVSSQLVHNRTYAFRLPPTFIEQARAFANYRENAIFSDASPNGIGNIASRSTLHSVLSALERISFNGDPLQLIIIETTYQPFISLFHQTGAVKAHPELAAIPDFGSALAIELRESAPPDVRNFLRFKFRNGTNEEFRTIRVYDHNGDIPVTEFIYRTEGSVISDHKQWATACGVSSFSFGSATGMLGGKQGACAGALLAVVMMFAMWLVVRFATCKRVGQGRQVLPSSSAADILARRSTEKADLPY